MAPGFQNTRQRAGFLMEPGGAPGLELKARDRCLPPSGFPSGPGSHLRDAIWANPSRAQNEPTVLVLRKGLGWAPESTRVMPLSVDYCSQSPWP